MSVERFTFISYASSLSFRASTTFRMQTNITYGVYMLHVLLQTLLWSHIISSEDTNYYTMPLMCRSEVHKALKIIFSCKLLCKNHSFMFVKLLLQMVSHQSVPTPLTLPRGNLFQRPELPPPPQANKRGDQNLPSQWSLHDVRLRGDMPSLHPHPNLPQWMDPLLPMRSINEGLLPTHS